MEQFRTVLQNLLLALENICFPDRCLKCKKQDTILCEQCAAILDRAVDPPIGLAALNYRNSITRKAIWLFKYGRRKDLAEILAPILSETILGELTEYNYGEGGEKLILVPIPLSEKRLGERGYNQSALLAQEVSKRTGIPYTDGLLKTRDTKAQMKLGKTARLHNLQGAFRADEHKIRDMDVILIDDIVTTGATFSAAQEALKSSGARKVLPFALAH